VEGKNGDLRGAAAVHHVRREVAVFTEETRKRGETVPEKTPIHARRVHKVSIVTKPNTEKLERS